MTDTADLVKELDGLNAELRLPVGNATDEELRDLGMKILARFNDGWPTIKAELSRLSARVGELEGENANLVAIAATAAELARSRADELIAAESRAAAMREALEKAKVDIATWSPDPTEPLEDINRALQEG